MLMAALWQNHEQHEPARRWLSRVQSFATCPMVQLGFARISSHPLLGYGLAPEQAFSILRRFVADQRHIFIADSIGCEDRVFRTDLLTGPNQIADRYLAALAQHNGFFVATLDQEFASSSESGSVTLVR